MAVTFTDGSAHLPHHGRRGADRRQRSARRGTPLPWTQWGGPNRNFQTQATGIKDRWPASGPRIVWKRTLGEGYSSPAVENGVLYTIYGKPKQEVVVAANAETGVTIWEQTAPMTFVSDASLEQG